MDSKILIHNVDPEEFKNKLLNALDDRFKQLKEQLELISNEEYLTRNEASLLLKISLPTLHSWVNKGLLKKYELGGSRYFLRSEIHQRIKESNS